MKEGRLPDALAVGLAQAFAITPGFSRSGFTISAALFRGIEGGEAARFSFLLSVPAIIGAVVLKAPDIASDGGIEGVNFAALLSGVMLSFLVGWISLKILLKVLSQGEFHRFSSYCFLVGAASICMGSFL